MEVKLLHKYFCFCSSFRWRGLDSWEQFVKFNWNNDYSFFCSLLSSSTVNFTLKSQMWICDQWSIVFSDFHGQSPKTRYFIRWSPSLNSRSRWVAESQLVLSMAPCHSSSLALYQLYLTACKNKRLNQDTNDSQRLQTS